MRITTIIITLVSFLASLTASAQSNDHNYIIQQTMLDEQGTYASTTIEYYDYLGCKEQVVSNAVKPASQTQALLSRTIHDGLGRERTRFLSVPVNGLDYQANVTFKYNDEKALSDITYDTQDRPLSITTPGTDMRGHLKKLHHWTNRENSVKRYVVAENGSLEKKGFYQQGTLEWERTEDEDGNTTDIYTNLLGLKVLERHSLGNEYTDTYFVYNDCYKLCYVLQPMYQKKENLEMFSFRYNYNEHGLLAGKALPGCEEITYKYDQADRLVSMQDGEMRKNGTELLHTYDGIGRIKEVTLRKADGSKSIEQKFFYDGDYEFVKDNSDYLPNEACHLLEYSREMGPSTDEVLTNGNTQVCGSIQRVSDGTYIATAIYYDRKGRIVEKNSKLLEGHTRRKQYTYNFIGKVITHTVIDYKGDLEVCRSVTRDNYDEQTGIVTSKDVETSLDRKGGIRKETVSYEYDDYGRLAAITHGTARHKH